MLKKMKAAAEKNSLSIDTLLRRWHDGRIKMFVTWKVLECAIASRGALPRRQLRADRRRPERRRVHRAATRTTRSLVAVPRLIANLVKPGTFPIGDVWARRLDPHLRLLAQSLHRGESGGRSIALRSLFARFPSPCWRRS